MQQQKLLCQKKTTLPYSSETGKHAGFFLSFYTLTQNLILFQSLQHNPHPLLPTQLQLKKHEPCGYAIAAIEHGKASPVYFELKRGDNCVNEFVKSLHVLARDIYNRKRAFYGPYRGPVPARENNTRCWICESETNDEAELVLDHCHYDSHFLGWAYQLCNTRRRTSNFTPMIGHNIKKYDIHHICLALAECEPETKSELYLLRTKFIYHTLSECS